MCVNHDVSVYPFFLRRFISQRIWSVSTDCLSMLFILLFYQITDNRLICHNHTLAQASLLIHTGMLGFLLLSSSIILQLVCISIMLVCKGPPRFKRIKFISIDFPLVLSLFIAVRNHCIAFALSVHFDVASTTSYDLFMYFFHRSSFGDFVPFLFICIEKENLYFLLTTTVNMLESIVTRSHFIAHRKMKPNRDASLTHLLFEQRTFQCQRMKSYAVVLV